VAGQHNLGVKELPIHCMAGTSFSEPFFHRLEKAGSKGLSLNAAWRANDIWPTALAVITADFVTRAGYLLQKGGDYKDIGVWKPHTWVPVNE